MTLDTIIERFKKLNLPMALNEFTITNRTPAPTLPYICYLIDETQRGSDQKNMIRDISASFELYTDRKPDKAIESRIERDVLFDVEFRKNQVKIDSENMVQTSYDFDITEKI